MIKLTENLAKNKNNNKPSTDQTIGPQKPLNGPTLFF